MPFLCEVMYRNLVNGPANRSVHLCDFPQINGPLIDEELSKDMDALLRLKEMGSAARNSIKLKVRQPVAEMKVQPGDERERRAVERFADQLCDELNVKKVTLHNPAQGPLGAPEGWVGVTDGGTQVLVDARITEELKREGMARDIVRQVQDLRKKSGLEMEDRIALYLGTESAGLRQAIEAHRTYIANETLATQWAAQPLGDGAYKANVKVDGQPLVIELRKVTG
jgi:isoleucyl-tRNA synthetase